MRFVFLMSIVILGSAMLSQYIGGLKPCTLCIYQRVPYGLTIALGLLALLSGRLMAPPRLRSQAKRILYLSALMFLVGGGIAGFHVGVEEGWWEFASTCTSGSSEGLTPEELRKQLLSTPIVRCDEVQWSMFGISMAGYNFFISTALALITYMLARMVGAVRSNFSTVR